MKKTPQKRRDGLYERTRTVNGKRVHFYGKTIKELNNKIMNYRQENDGSVTFGKIAERYFTNYSNEHPQSIRSVKRHVDRLAETFGDDAAGSLTPRDFQIYFRTLAPLSAKTVSACRNVAKQIYDFGIVNFGLTDNPVVFAKMPNGLSRTKRTVPADDEIDRIRKRTDDPDALLFLLALYTGMRRGEILALKYGDIDRDRRVINVTKAVYYIGNDPYIKEPKTAAGTRQIVIVDPLFDILPTGPKNDYIFGGKKPLTARVIQRKIDNYRNRNGITASLHQLRHAFATMLYNVGIDERAAMDLLGHADISTTRNIYTHITNEKRAATAAALNDYLSKK